MLRNEIVIGALSLLAISGCGVGSDSIPLQAAGKAEAAAADGIALGHTIQQMVQHDGLVLRSQARGATAQDPVYEAPLAGVGSSVILDPPLSCTDPATLKLLHKALALPAAQVSGAGYDTYFAPTYPVEFFLLYTSPETAGSEPEALGFSELHYYYLETFEQICVLEVWPSSQQAGEVYVIGRTAYGALAGVKAANFGSLYIPPDL
jgi:hypothetical protein